MHLIWSALAGGAIALVTSIVSNRISYMRQQRNERREYLIRLYDKVVLLCRVDLFEDSPVLLNKMIDVTYSNVLELSMTFETINLFDFFVIKNEQKILEKVKESLNSLKVTMAKTNLSDPDINLSNEFKEAKKIVDELKGLKQSIFKKVNKEVKKI
jgi:hypothetical protein